MTNKQLKSRSFPGAETYQTNIRLKPDYVDDLLACRGLVEHRVKARASNSLIMKRAIRVYRRHLEGLARDPGSWRHELHLLDAAR